LSNSPEKTEETSADVLNLLIDVVERDFAKTWHLPCAENMIVYVTALMMAYAGVLLFFALYVSHPPEATAILIAAIANFSAAGSLLVSSIMTFERFAIRGRVHRITETLEYEKRFKLLNKTKYKVILRSLVDIRNTFEVPLQELREEMPGLFWEERLLQYLVKSP